MGRAMSDRIVSFVCVSPPPTPWNSVPPFIESIMESDIVGPTDDVISTSVNEMNNSFT